ARLRLRGRDCLRGPAGGGTVPAAPGADIRHRSRGRCGRPATRHHARRCGDLAGVGRDAGAARAGGLSVKTWLLRNRWALLALPVLLIALPLPQIDRYYNVFVASAYRVAVQASPGEQVSYGGGRMRLVSAGPFVPTSY